MKKRTPSLKTFLTLLLLTAILSGFYVYILSNPISYRVSYTNRSIYEDEVFEGSMEFYSDGTVINYNTNFKQTMQMRYYYRDGYIFFPMPEAEGDYEAEVAYINENFEEVINIPFYACKINAFRMISTGVDGIQSIYTCKPAVICAGVFGLAVLLLAIQTVISFVRFRKVKKPEASGTIEEVKEGE